MELNWSSPSTWWITALGIDFGYYWYHRFVHGKDSSVQRLNQEQLGEKGLENLVFNDEDSGFQSALYHDSERDEYIYAYAGTNDFSSLPQRNLISSSSLAFSFSSHQHHLPF